MGVLEMLGVRRREQNIPEEETLLAEQGQINPYEMQDEGTLVSFVQEEYTKRLSERKPFELQWRLNMAFIEGNQYLDINTAAQTVEEIPKMYWWQEREVFNHIAPNIETRIARLSKMRPILKVRPASNDKEDIRKTKISSQLLSNIYYDNKMKDRLMDILPWIEYTGTVLIKNIWNPEIGKTMELPQITEDGVEYIEQKEGDLQSIICPPQEILPDSSYNQEISDCKSIIHARAYHINDIKEIWGIEVIAEDVTATLLNQNSKAFNTDSNYNYSTTKLKEHAIVKEFWEIPTKNYPEGRLIIVAGAKLLYFGALPYRIGKDNSYGLPFTKAVCIKKPGCFWGKTVTERLIPIQRRYNALRNRKAEYLSSCAIGGWTIEDGSMDLDSLEQDGGSPGFIAIYKRGHNPPRKTENPPLPVTFETEERTLLQEFSILSGVSEISRQSAAPVGVKSGVAMSLALEQDETRLAATAGNIEEFLVENGEQWLRLCKQYVKGYRLLESVGRNNLVDVYDWTGSDLKADDVIMESLSGLSETPAQRRQMIFDLLATGLFLNPDTKQIDRETRARILEILEFGDWEGIDGDDQLHISKAERENRMLSESQFTLADNYDDHMIHIKRHNEYRLTVDFETLKVEQPQVAELFDLHVQSHLLQVLQNMPEPQPNMESELIEQPQ
jgi:hypothetical protein